MLNDIFATSMRGRYTTTRDGELIEQGVWTYRGYGNAEVTLEADAERIPHRGRFSVRLHSCERQVDELFMRDEATAGDRQEFTAVIAGRTMTLTTLRSDGTQGPTGVLNLPDETIFMGPSPIWMMHLAMVDPPPLDRRVTTPIARFDFERGEFVGELFSVTRGDRRLEILVLDESGAHTGNLAVDLAEDGFPAYLRSGVVITEIVRVPMT